MRPVAFISVLIGALRVEHLRAISKAPSCQRAANTVLKIESCQHGSLYRRPRHGQQKTEGSVTLGEGESTGLTSSRPTKSSTTLRPTWDPNSTITSRPDVRPRMHARLGAPAARSCASSPA